MKKAIAASWVLDGQEKQPIADSAVVVTGDKVEAIVQSSDLKAKYPGIEVEQYPGCTLLPGFVNSHSHLIMPGTGPLIEDALQVEEEMLLLSAHENALRSLASGVTTLADAGARNDVSFTLRRAVQQGIVTGPRLVLCGQPITSKRGHCWLMNGETQCISEVRSLAARLVGKGANFLKVMASGGGTLGTETYKPQFTRDELSMIVAVSRDAGKPSIAHCCSTSTIQLALECGFDVIAHGMFMESETTTAWDLDLAKLAADRQVFWDPTLEVMRRSQEWLEKDPHANPAVVRARANQYRFVAETAHRLYEMGVPILAGSDEGWRFYRFGGYAQGLVTLVEHAGMEPIDAIMSATSLPAKALRISDRVGSLLPGRFADALVIRGRPFDDIRSVKNVESVFLGGKRVTG